MAPGEIWDVTGGADKGGIVARCGCDLSSEAFDNRLATGAKIKELQLKGQRLHYKLLTGSGPAEGWVSLSLKGQPLVSKQNSDRARFLNLTLDKLLLRHESEGTFAENYEWKEDLGEGGFASVFLAKNLSTGQERAVKRLPYRKQEELLQIDAECRILVRLNHPHIMKFYEFFKEPKMIYLVTELCTGGTFHDFFRDGLWDMEDARILFQQVILAIQHCHKLRVLHHDLKPQNCLILKASGRPFAKVIDFGIATIMQKSDRPPSPCSGSESSQSEEDQNTIAKMTGSPFWRAPEVLDPDACSGPKADLYSIGLIMFLCLTGTHPLHHGSWCEPMGARESLDMYDDIPIDCLDDNNVPDEAQNIIMALLETDRDKRLSARQALESPWFETSRQVAKEYPETPKMFDRTLSYSALSDVVSPQSSPHSSPRSGNTLGWPKSPSTCRKTKEEPIQEDEFDNSESSPQVNASPIYLCPADHELKQFLTDEDGYYCSICKCDFPEGTSLNGCRDCDFDACCWCLKTMKVKKDQPVSITKLKKRVRMGNFVPEDEPLPTDESVKPHLKSPVLSPKDTKFRAQRKRHGSIRSALLLDRVLRYKDLEPWHCAVLRLIAHNSHESDVAKQRERYLRMDTNKSGAVSRKELQAAMVAHGNIVDDDQLEGIFLNLDSQGTGEIEYNEWIASTMKPSIICQEQVMRMVFDFFDTKHRGSFGHEELKAVLGANIAQTMLTRAGVNDFTWESFMSLMKDAATR